MVSTEFGLVVGPLHLNCWTLKSTFLTLIYLIAIINLSEQQSSTSQHNQHHQHHHHHHHHKTSDADVKPVPGQHEKVLIPNLPQTHYQYWLKNHPRAAKNFGDVCDQVGPRLSEMNDLAEFQKLHANLTFEDHQYMSKLDYGKQVLGLICSKIKDVSKSCWGYENNCQEIHLMPECKKVDSAKARDEHEQKIAWFSQADFGYILDRAKELAKYCAPDKKANLAEVSSLECTKHFTTCRGTNLFAHFNISALSYNKRNIRSPTHSRVLSTVGGWGCDLQRARISEESGRSGLLESWYGELKAYDRVDNLKPSDNCDFVEDAQVFFVKINPSNNLNDFLSSFINLYATIHLNNRFSENNRIVIWDRNLPRGKTFEQLWYAFSRLPPTSIGQFDGKRICFKRFIFALPPNMVDGLHTDKPLVEGCSKSGLYNAFHKHVIHRLRVPNTYDLSFHQKTQGRLLRIVILSRASRSEFRNILNEIELETAIRAHSKNYVTNVRVLKYNSMDFGHVLLDTLNSDIMIGLHGTGLAYSLFLPDWAGLIELYDCGKDRYHRLARLRGVSYFKPVGNLHNGTEFVKKVRVPESSSDWSRLNQSRLLDHDEFSNYEVNVAEFMKLFVSARDQVLEARENHFRSNAATRLATASTENQPTFTTPSADEPEAKHEQTTSTTTTPPTAPPPTPSPTPPPTPRRSSRRPQTTTTSTTTAAPTTTTTTTTTPTSTTSSTTAAPTTTTTTTTTTTPTPTTSSTTAVPSTTTTTTPAPSQEPDEFQEDAAENEINEPVRNEL